MSRVCWVALLVTVGCSSPAGEDEGAPPSTPPVATVDPPVAPSTPDGPPPELASPGPTAHAGAAAPQRCFQAVTGDQLVEGLAEDGSMGEGFSDEVLAPNTPVDVVPGSANRNGIRLRRPFSGRVAASGTQRVCESVLEPARYPTPEAAPAPAPALRAWAAGVTGARANTPARRLSAEVRAELSSLVDTVHPSARARWVYRLDANPKRLIVGAGFDRQRVEEAPGREAGSSIGMVIVGLLPDGDAAYRVTATFRGRMDSAYPWEFATASDFDGDEILDFAMVGQDVSTAGASVDEAADAQAEARRWIIGLSGSARVFAVRARGGEDDVPNDHRDPVPGCLTRVDGYPAIFSHDTARARATLLTPEGPVEAPRLFGALHGAVPDVEFLHPAFGGGSGRIPTCGEAGAVDVPTRLLTDAHGPLGQTNVTRLRRLATTREALAGATVYALVSG